jgi:hypothetical protein
MATMTHRTTFTLDEATMVRIKDLAALWKASQAEVVRRAVSTALTPAPASSPKATFENFLKKGAFNHKVPSGDPKLLGSLRKRSLPTANRCIRALAAGGPPDQPISSSRAVAEGWQVGRIQSDQAASSSSGFPDAAK